MKTQCCIAGGGPAGMMLGYMLSEAGIDVTVLEKWPDFFRDFRGDTIHPSTMENLAELGILEDFLALKHEEVPQMTGVVGSRRIVLADFSTLKMRCPFISFVPQWDFLNLLRDKAQNNTKFRLLMNTAVTDVIEKDGKVSGVRAKSGDQQIDISCDLVIGADGRSSTVREKAGLTVQSIGAPMDVLWFRLTRKDTDPSEPAGRFGAGRIVVLIYRENYWQCGFVIKKDSLEQLKLRGLDSFRRELIELAPFLSDRVNEITDLDELKLLSVRVDRLRKWYKPGLICIGDAAHAMSPVGGIGINLAIQDAVAAANVLVPAFRRGQIMLSDLAAIQNRRQLPTVMTQAVQVFLQNRLINRVLSAKGSLRLNSILSTFNRFTFLRRLPALFIGKGFRSEHVTYQKAGPLELNAPGSAGFTN